MPERRELTREVEIDGKKEILRIQFSDELLRFNSPPVHQMIDEDFNKALEILKEKLRQKPKT